ncbi:MAG: hypothetical protein IMZ71_01505 [Chloroflexi bacterium]|nr:hypothetical protein [Chloroflexota bacterium]
MGETKHTPEPWIDDPEKGSAYGAAPVIVANLCWRGDKKREIAKVLFDAGSEDPEVHANARRIVACVNACEGINPEAVPDLLEALMALLSLRLYADGEGPVIINDYDEEESVQQAKAAIAKAISA